MTYQIGYQVMDEPIIHLSLGRVTHDLLEAFAWKQHEDEIATLITNFVIDTDVDRIVLNESGDYADMTPNIVRSIPHEHYEDSC